MFDLKIGDVVYHNGVKRKVTFVRRIFGGTFLHLKGWGYMVPARAVKPVFRLTENVRAELLVGFVKTISPSFPIHSGWQWICTQGVEIHRKEYDLALDLLRGN